MCGFKACIRPALTVPNRTNQDFSIRSFTGSEYLPIAVALTDRDRLRGRLTVILRASA